MLGTDSAVIPVHHHLSIASELSTVATSSMKSSQMPQVGGTPLATSCSYSTLISELGNFLKARTVCLVSLPLGPVNTECGVRESA